MATPKLTDAIANAAILGFEEQKRKIDLQIAELRAMQRISILATESPAGRPRRRMSAKTRKAMGEAQRKRWAEKEASSTTPPVKAAKALKKKRVLSAAGKAAIVAALKKRWAAKKSEAKK